MDKKGFDQKSVYAYRFCYSEYVPCITFLVILILHLVCQNRYQL